jgi:NADH-quinone oxidoreductase subunit J
MDIHAFLFWTIALLTGLCAIATVVTHNIVRAATWLLFTLAGTSGIFFLLGADLVGAIQLLVYVGGTLVLVVFGVMLTAQGPFISMKTGSAEWAISALVGVLLFGVLTLSALSVGAPGPPANSVTRKFAPETRLAETRDRELKDQRDRGEITEEQYREGLQRAEKQRAARAPYSAVLGEGFLGVGVGPAHKDPQTQKIVRTSYLLPFEIVSVHLLVVLIGAAYLARAKRRRVTVE